MADSEQICFCFGYSKDDIIADYAQHGESRILARIVAAKKLGDCQCKSKNPSGK